MKNGLLIATFTGLLIFGFSALGAGKPGNAAKGKDLFDSNCAVCHNADSTEKKMGPGLKGVFKRVTLANKKKVTDANVLEMINKGSDSGMPPFADVLSDTEKADVLAYLKTL